MEIVECEATSDSEMLWENSPDEIQLMEWKMLVEACLFMSPTPMTLEVLGKKVREIPFDRLPSIVKSLQDDYKQAEGALEIYQYDANTYCIQVKAEIIHYPEVIKFTQGKDLTSREISTLAFVCYNQPIEMQDMVDLLGKFVKKSLKTLLKRQFLAKKKEKIEFMDENDKPQIFQTTVYVTTPKFAEYLGVPNDLDEIRRTLDEIIANR